MIRVRLDSAQRNELKRRTHEKGITPRVRDRLEMIRLSDAGWSIPKIASHLGCHDQTVRTHIKAFLQNGFDCLPDKTRPGRPSTVTAEHLDALERLLDEPTRTWTTPQLVEWLRQKYEINIGSARLGLLLRRRDFRWKRTKYSVKHKQLNPNLQATKVAELEELKKQGPKRNY